MLHSLGFILSSLSWCASAQQSGAPIDRHATRETVSLLKNLHALQKEGVMFGHQDALAYGYNWKYQEGRSDVKETSGQYPAVYGYDLGHLETGSAFNLDSVPFDKMREYILTAFNQGAVVTLSWHLNNPLGGSSWDVKKGTVASILPGGANHKMFNQWLDRLSGFMNDLKTSKGIAVPVLFRPYHELSGNWFWWGESVTTPDEFKQLWKYTVNYLQKKKVHNLLYVFNTDKFKSKEHYLERYPGDEWVDILSFDTYQFNDPRKDSGFYQMVKRQLDDITAIAKVHNKPVAFSETGFEGIPFENWWTETLWPLIENYPISYVLVWRNAGLMPSGKYHYYAPYKGHPSESDFKKFEALPETLFQEDVQKKNLYN
jgi:hypothetical protein